MRNRCYGILKALVWRYRCSAINRHRDNLYGGNLALVWCDMCHAKKQRWLHVTRVTCSLAIQSFGYCLSRRNPSYIGLFHREIQFLDLFLFHTKLHFAIFSFPQFGPDFGTKRFPQEAPDFGRSVWQEIPDVGQLRTGQSIKLGG